VSARLRDPKLRECVQCGVGFHTAGLEAADRTGVEQVRVRVRVGVRVGVRG
jgi:replicative superfamily II helicase